MTYLEYTNIILQSINEVPLTSQQFSGARGLHQFAKESINRTYFDIIQEYKWPWMHSLETNAIDTLELSGERSITPTATWTQIPVDNAYKDAIDWSSIYYRNADGDKQTLIWIGWEEYEDRQDYVDGYDQPKFIVQSADGRSMGLMGLDDFTDPTVGKIFYRLWTRPSRFTFAEDIIPMPEMHFNVLVDGALHHLWSFRGNVDQAQIAYSRFEKGISKMKRKYSNQSLRLRSV